MTPPLNLPAPSPAAPAQSRRKPATQRGSYTTAARQARINAGLTVAAVARRMHCSEERIRLAERAGGRCSFNTARDLAAIYHCDQMAFINPGRHAGHPGV